MTGRNPGLPFLKMQAQGNDFVILDATEHELPGLDAAFVRNICDRRFGIGCDQLLVMEPDDRADFRLRIFNNDGSEAANCGNGLRCVADFWMRGHGTNEVRIAVGDRTVEGAHSPPGIRIGMGEARILEATGAHVDVEIGNEHRVFFEATESFPEDRNVEIVTGQIADRVYIDIIERGAGRTLACGSGACAAAAAVWHLEREIRPLSIVMPGGEVRVSGTFENVVLEGPVAWVARGVYLGGTPSD